MRTAFEREGAIRSVDLLAAFATLWRRRSSGVLRFSRGGETVRFDLAEGDVSRVTASDPGFDTIQVLLRAGKIKAAALEGRRFPSGTDRALAAREMGLLTERDWRWGERIRDVEILAYLVGWLDGTYEFDPAARPGTTESRIGIHRLILELFLRSRDRAFVHHALPAVDVPLQRSADFDEKFATLGLTPDALAVAAAVDGRATAAEISRKTPPDPFSVDKLLAALATLGLLHPEYAAEPAPETGSVAPEQEEEEELPPPAPPIPPAAPPPPPPVADEALPEPEDLDICIEPLDLPIAAPVEPSEPEPALVAWDSSAPEPMDQRLDTAAGEIEPSSRRSVPGAVWLLLLLAIAVGALLLSRARERGEAPVEPGAATEPVLTATIPLVQPTLSAPGGTGFPAAAVPTEPVSRPSAAPAPTLEPPPTPVPPTPMPPTEVPPTPPPTLPPTPVPTRVPPTPVPTRVPPTPVPTPVPTRPPTAIPPTRIPPTRVPPTAVPPTRIPPTRIPPSPIPTARPVPTALPVPPSGGAAAGGRTRAEWLALAERDQRGLASQPRALYTIQLELVCELPSLAEAWRFDRRGEMWLAAAEHGGQTCFRVFWGRYPDLESARRARETVPRFFFTAKNRPTLVSTRAALLP